MKTIVRQILFALCLVLPVVSCSKSPQDKLVGEWRATDYPASFVFEKNGNLKLVHGNIVQDGQTIGGKFTWKLDASHEPMHLDLVITPSSGEERILPHIGQFFPLVL